jgi:predicted ATP-binding protein involved in virulence
MAKDNGYSKLSSPAVYFKSLTIENIKCFKGQQSIDLSNGNGKPAQWTVILGNNNTGKTTILKCLAGLSVLKQNALLVISDETETGETLYPIYNNVIGDKAVVDCFTPTGVTKQLIYERKKKHSADPIFEKNLAVFSYGASRKMSTLALAESETKKPHASLFYHEDLPNMEDWLLNLFLADKLGQTNASKVLEIALKLLSSGLLPDVHEVRLNSRERGVGFVNFAEFRTDFGWIRLRGLGYGYQTMMAWVLDLVKRMVERYPDSSNPLAEAAIVLVDEIDLHLHPDWQRRIITHLGKYFPNTQFIVTAHSPLVVQSADEINLVVLRKDGEAVQIEQPKIHSFKGWTVEEIMTDLMDLAGQTMSDTYFSLMEQFEEALDEDNIDKAEKAYQELDKILHHDSSARKLMQIQMTSLNPVEETL